MRARGAFLGLLMVLTAISGCLGANEPEPNDEASAWNGHPESAPLSTWLHDISEAVEHMPTVTHHIRTPVPGPFGESMDVELDTWIIRPAVAEPVPVVLEVTPYYGGGEPESLGRVGAELVARGYAVGVSSVRGTGNSGGCFTQGGPSEAVDTATVIEHVAGQSWSNGNVGLMGVSYPGTTPQDVWVEAPPSLKTIIPISGISDLYKYTFVNGVMISDTRGFNTYYWALVGASPAGLSGGAQATDPASIPGTVVGEVCEDQVDVQQSGAESDVTGNKDEYWQLRDFPAEYWAKDDDVERASVFYIHGLQDWNVKPHNMEDILEVYVDSGVPMKIWLGQWGHAWPQSTGTSEAAQCHYNNATGRGENCRNDWWNTTLVAWLDQFLKDKDTGILDAPMAQIQSDDGVWRHEHSWPPVDAVDAPLYFTSDGLSFDGPGSGEASYVVGASDSGQPESTRLVLKSEPFEANTTLSGFPTFTGTVTAAGDRANLIFSIGEENPEGGMRWINHGALSLNHADGLEEGRESVADMPIDVELDLFPQDDVIHAEHRLVISFGANIAGGPGPGLGPIHDPGTITIDLASAALHLPVDATIVPEDPQPYVGPRDPVDRDCIVIICT